MGKVLCFTTENTICVTSAYEKIPSIILETGLNIFIVCDSFDAALLKITDLYSFDDLFEFGAASGIELGKVYRR